MWACTDCACSFYWTMSCACAADTIPARKHQQVTQEQPSVVLQILSIFGKHVLHAPAAGDPYSHKYKGIWLAITVLTRALAGNYCNFGVFELYGDPALKVGPYVLGLRAVCG